MGLASITAPHALRQPQRIDLRAVGGLVLMAVMVAGSLSFWTATDDSRSVVVAARDLPAGAVLQPADLSTASVRMDGSLYRAAVPAADLDRLLGQRLAQSVQAGELLAQVQVSHPGTPGPGQVAMKIPIGASDVADGVVPGTDVQVLSTVNKGRPDARTSLVLSRARVAAVDYAQGQAVVNTGGGRVEQPRVSSLSLILSRRDAQALSAARWDGDLSVALLPPEGR